MNRQHLILDADDTLWENNIYFEEAFDSFARYLNHPRMTDSEVRDVLDAIEAVNAKKNGYGSLNFGRNLIETFGELAGRPVNAEDRAAITGFAEAILTHPIVLRPGVAGTLEYLSERHELTLFTKGQPDEQRAKIERSGLEIHFEHAEVTREKDVRAYLNLAVNRGFHAPRTWMIGNSPKSDVNPALAAGFNAVFLPHPRTWILEREELAAPPQSARLLVLEHFGELRAHF